MEGSCLCGRLRWKADQSKWCAHCHCSMCQRAHGAAFVTWLGLDETVATIVDDDALAWFESSAEGRRGFCHHCGTMLFFKSSRWPGELHVTRASVLGEADQEPRGHAFYDSHVDWVSLNDDLPR